MNEIKANRKWQNLIYLKCPNCGTELEASGNYLICPNMSKTEVGNNCFFIKKERVAEILLDKKHPANVFLTDEERLTVKKVVNDLGFSIE